MNVKINIVEKCHDSIEPVLDIIAEDPDSAFELGRIMEDLFGNYYMDVLISDGHGIRIKMNRRATVPSLKEIYETKK